MKKTTLFSLFICCISLLSAQNCIIQGELSEPAFQNRNIYFVNANTGTILDTITLENNHFQCTLRVTEPFVLYLQTDRLQNGNYHFSNLIAEEGSIFCNMLTDSISGTPTNNLYHQYIKERTAKEKVIHQLSDQLGEAEMLSAANKELLKQQMEEAIGKLSQFTITTFVNNKDNGIGALAFNYLLDLSLCSFEEAQELLRSAKPIVTTNQPIVAKMKALEKTNATAVGKKYTDLELTDVTTGKRVKLSNYIKGKIALIDYWASWCRPCRAEIPNIAEIHKKYGSKEFVVISLNVWDKPEPQKRAIEDLKMNWIMLSDDTPNATNTYGIDGIPHIMLIDKDGTIIARNLRGEQIEEAVKKALSK